MLSGSWPGEIFFFRGGPERTFAAPIKLRDKDGKFINIGGGIRNNGGLDGMLLIAGDAKFEQRDGKPVVVYNGEVIDAENRQVGITGTASAVFAADWDGDGDLDLIVGEIGGNVYLVPNEGTPTEPIFGKEVPLEAGGRPIRVEGDAGPTVADWDGDGDHDLIVGDGSGKVMMFENVGGSKAPELAEGRALVGSGTMDYFNPPSEPTRGGRAKVCVADWNGDGHPDLLLGDIAYQRPDRPEPSPEEMARIESLRKELGEIEVRYRELSDALFRQPRGIADVARNVLKRLRGEGGDELPPMGREALQTEMSEVAQRMQAIREQLPSEIEYHGWVWLFLRQPVEHEIVKAEGGAD